MPNLPDPTPPSIDEIETILRTALDKKKSEGWKFDPFVGYNVLSKTCCLLGAVREFTDDGRFDLIAVRKLNISLREAHAIEAGFMDMSEDYCTTREFDPGLVRLGQKLRKEYIG